MQYVNLKIIPQSIGKSNITVQIPLDYSLPVDILYQAVRNQLKLEPSDTLSIYRNGKLVSDNIDNYTSDTLIALIKTAEEVITTLPEQNTEYKPMSFSSKQNTQYEPMSYSLKQNTKYE